MSQTPPSRPSWSSPSAPGLSPAAESPAAPADSPAGRPPLSRWRWLVLLFPVLLVACPVLVGEMPHEIAMWYGAAALERHLDDDPEGALDRLRQGLDWQPDNVALLAQRSQWRLEQGDPEGSLADAQKAVEQHPQEATPYMQRATVLQRLGRHREAIDDWNRLVDLAAGGTHVVVRYLDGTRQVDVFNGRAYARAVGDLEAELGLADVNISIDRLRENVAVLDTRGFLLYRLGRYEQARADLDRAVAMAEDYNQEVVRAFDPPAAQEGPSPAKAKQIAPTRPDPVETVPPVDTAPADTAPADTAGPTDRAPADSSAGSKDTQDAADGTRVAPKDEAVSQPEDAQDVVAGELLRSRFLDPRELQQFRHEVAELVAVIRYHRSLALEALGEVDLAKADRERVVELGFEPGPELY